jgi:hypothetical protein
MEKPDVSPVYLIPFAPFSCRRRGVQLYKTLSFFSNTVLLLSSRRGGLRGEDIYRPLLQILTKLSNFHSLEATTDISIFTSFGRRDTCTVSRAGNESLKNEP